MIRLDNKYEDLKINRFIIIHQQGEMRYKFKFYNRFHKGKTNAKCSAKANVKQGKAVSTLRIKSVFLDLKVINLLLE